MFKEIVLFVVCAIVHIMIYILSLILVLNASPKLQTSQTIEDSVTPSIRASTPTKISPSLQDIDLSDVPFIELKQFHMRLRIAHPDITMIELLTLNSWNKRFGNSIWFVINADALKEKTKRIKLHKEATHVFFEMDLDQAISLEVVQDSDFRFSFNLEEFMKAYADPKFQSNTKINMMKLNVNSKLDQYDIPTWFNSLPIIVDLSDKTLKSFEDVIQESQMSEERKEIALSDISKNKLIREGHLYIGGYDSFYIFLSKDKIKDKIGNQIILSEETTHVFFKINYNQAISLGIINVYDSRPQTISSDKFFEFYLYDEEFQDSIDAEIIKLAAHNTALVDIT